MVGILPTYPTNGGGGGGSITGSLAGLSDVSISMPISAQVLSFGAGGKWRNTNLTDIPAFANLQAQVTSISVSAFTPITTTAALTGNLQSQISAEIVNRQAADQNLQQQINEVASSAHVVFSEIVTGDGITTLFQLTGNISNGQFISGGWNPLNVLNTLESDVTDLNGKPIYDGGILSLFTRHRIYVDTINTTGLVTTDYIPLNNQVFKIWYWYNLQPNDRIYNYYRDDYVAKMEENSGDLATAIVANVVNFNNILSNTDVNVQLALETLDKHTHPQIADLSASIINLQATKQDNITLLGSSGVVVTESPTNTWTISVTGNSTTNIIAGNGITVVPSGNDSIVAVTDYISKTDIQLINATVVHVTGNETIFDTKNFAITPLVSGTYNVLHQGNAAFEWHQTTPSSLWDITHPLNKHPSVTTANETGGEFSGTLTYINNNNVTVKFFTPQTGYAYLN